MTNYARLPGRLLASLLILLTCPAAGAATEIAGHLKSLNIHSQRAPGGTFPEGDISSNSLRLDLSGEAPPLSRWEISLDNQLLYTDPPGFVPLPRDIPNRVVDLETNLREGERFADRLQVDRLNLQGRFAGVDWTAGRQAIGFGRIVLFSPLDIVAPFAPDALDTEVRPGVDALRAVRYFGLGGQLGATAVFGESRDSHSFLATASQNLRGIDLLAVGGSLRNREVGGIGLAGSLGGLGIKGEAAFYDGKEGDLHDAFPIAAAEGWYRFENGLILLVEYLYNGAGAGRPEEYPLAAGAATHREGLGFLLGRHYLLAAPSYEIHPLATLSALLIRNLEDESLLLRPLLDISLSDALDLQAFWTFNEGDGLTPGPVPGGVVPRSEFGSAGGSGGVFLKYYF